MRTPSASVATKGTTRRKRSGKALRPKAKENAATSKKAASEAGASPRLRLDVDERRAQLVELGLTEFGTRTYDEVSIDLIAQSAGISKGLLYHYFPTKRAFYLACIRTAASRLVAQMDGINEGSPLEQLHAGLDRYLSYVRAHGRAYSNLMRAGVGIDRELASVVDETRATLLDRLTSGMSEIFPSTPSALGSPMMKIALHGWIGLAEAASITWVEACVEAENNPAAPPAPAAADVRNLLAGALVAIVQSATA